MKDFTLLPFADGFIIPPSGTNVQCRPGYFGVPALVCINKHDINEDNTHQIEHYCLRQGIEVAARVPFDNAVTEAMVRGLLVVEYAGNGIAGERPLNFEDELRNIYSKIKRCAKFHA
ncbi:MAG TPA: hypothetical protein VMW86_00580 [Dehalococcoidales bacterium]|nr:hypothetical protein [Dehalococcoidales bacterium]